MEEKRQSEIPDQAIAFIDLVVKKFRYRKKVRQDVRDELVGHFEDELRDCTNDQERDQKAQRLIADFGDPKVLATLMRRAKKRCRPLWAKVVVHGLQAIGIIILYLIICALPLTIGRPTIRINYIDWINDLGRAGKDESLNAKPYLDKAVELAAKAPMKPTAPYVIEWPNDMNDQELKASAEFLDESTEALDALREAAGKPCYWVHYDLDPNLNRLPRPADPSPLSFSAGIVGPVMKDLPLYRDLAKRMAFQVKWKAFNGDIEGACDDALVLARFGIHLEGKGLLVEQLVGMAIEGGALYNQFAILDKADVPAGTLKKTRQRLDGYYSAQKAIISLDVEKALLYEYVQKTFTDDGRGNGRVLMHGLPLVAGDTRDTLTGFLLFKFPDRWTVTEKIDQVIGGYARLMDTPPSLTAFQDQVVRLERIALGNIFLMLNGPAFHRIVQQGWWLKTGRQGLIAVLGILEFKKEKGDYPKDLNKVVSSGYLDKLPIDPYSGGPLVYKRTDGGFLLYSLGINLKDDGGKPGVDSYGKPRKWADNGDCVFWPVADQP